MELALEQFLSDTGAATKPAAVTAAFLDQIGKMWETQPHFTDAQLHAIAVPVWIVDADHDEMVTHDQPTTMYAWMPGAGLLIEPDVSHFAFIQAPEQFTADVERFLNTR